MELNLYDDWRLISDANCWTLQRKHVIKGQSQWQNELYYPDLHSAARGSYQRLLRECKAINLEDAEEAEQQIRERISYALGNLVPGDWEIRA